MELPCDGGWWGDKSSSAVKVSGGEAALNVDSGETEAQSAQASCLGEVEKAGWLWRSAGADFSRRSLFEGAKVVFSGLKDNSPNVASVCHQGEASTFTVYQAYPI